MRAEALSPALVPTPTILSQAKAPAFLDNFDAKRSNIGTEPAVYSNTEIMGDGLMRSYSDRFYQIPVSKCTSQNAALREKKQLRVSGRRNKWAGKLARRDTGLLSNLAHHLSNAFGIRP